MTKRKNEEEKAAARAKRKAPFTAPKDAATKALVVRNASCSPLLRIPLEVRNSIWRLVLGDQLIHLQYYNVKWETEEQDEKRRCCKHVVCHSDGPERESCLKETNWRQPHFNCELELANKWGGDEDDIMYAYYKREHSKSMNLTALRVCRQIYTEANLTLWTTNTFSFDRATPTFAAFMECRTTRQKQLLRKLRLQMDWRCEEDKSWNRVLGMPLIRTLTGLRCLRLQINHSMEAAFYQTVKARGNELGLFQMRQFGFVDRLATVPLSDVEVFVSDLPDRDYFSDDSEESRVGPPWTVEDRVEYAEGIRKILLNPKGAEKHANEQKELQQFHREDG